jgi:hypothetical protein
MTNVVGELPQFTADDSAGTEKVKEVKETSEITPNEEVITEEVKETPAELPADTKPAEGETQEPKGDDVEVKQVQGLLSEREKLLKEIRELRGQRREIRKEETQEVITQVADKLDDLNDVDVTNIERVLKAKGYVTKEENQKLHYESVKNDKLNEFLSKYPEYKPENDPNDINWNAFQRELTFYKMPQDPKLITEVLERAHRNIAAPTVPATRAVEQRIATARKGGGGSQRTSSGKSLPPNLRRAYEDGGWSEEEIKELEAKL